MSVRGPKGPLGPGFQQRLKLRPGKRSGTGIATRMPSDLPSVQKPYRPSAGQSGDGPFTIAATNPCKIWPRSTIPAFAAGSTTTASSIESSCDQRYCASTPTWSAGRSGSSNACAGDAGEQENGWPGFVMPIQRSSLIGASCMSAAEHRKPCESRGSCTVLGARGGESPPRDSPEADYQGDGRAALS